MRGRVNAMSDHQAEAAATAKPATMNYTIVAIVFLLIGLFTGHQIWNTAGDSEPVLVDEAQLRGIIRQVLEDSDIAVKGDLPRDEIDRFAMVDDDPYLGAEDAPVVIVEFSDFFCSFCKRHFDNTFTPLLENYGQHIRYVYRDFARLRPESADAAAAAQCAFAQGKFWEFHGALFANQPDINRDFYIATAEANALDMDAFTACIDEGMYASEVQLDGFDGQIAGVSGTPSFFINGQALSGAQHYSIFERMVQRALQDAGIDAPAG